VGARALGRRQRILSRNLDQSMLKNAYFLEKDVKNRFSIGGLAPKPPLASGGRGLRPQTPTLLLPPTITTLSSSFLALNAVYYLQKRTNFAYSKFLQPFFTSNYVVFVAGGAKIFLAPGRRVS